MVQRGGFVEVHDREAIVPARVTETWHDGIERVNLREDVVRTILTERESAAPPAVHVSVTYSPRVEISGNADAGSIKQVLDQHSNELATKLESGLMSMLTHHRERT
jgi:hypothetical protein